MRLGKLRVDIVGRITLVHVNPAIPHPPQATPPGVMALTIPQNSITQLQTPATTLSHYLHFQTCLTQRRRQTLTLLERCSCPNTVSRISSLNSAFTSSVDCLGRVLMTTILTCLQMPNETLSESSTIPSSQQNSSLSTIQRMTSAVTGIR